MAIVKNDIKKAVDIQDNKTLAKAAVTPGIKKKQGRPKKFNEDIIARVDMGFTQNQITLIDARAKELGITVRLDYFRKLLADDIKGFNL